MISDCTKYHNFVRFSGYLGICDMFCFVLFDSPISGVPRRHPHRWQELVTLPSVGANP